MSAYSLGNALSAGCLSGVFLISAYKKIVDRKAIMIWFSGKFSLASAWLWTLFYAVISLEFLLALVSLVFGPDQQLLIYFMGGLLLALLPLGRLVMGRAGCPCFGMASLLDRGTNVLMTLVPIGLAVLVGLALRIGEPRSWLAWIAVLLIMAGFYMGSKASMIVRPSNLSMRGKGQHFLPSVEGVSLEGRVSVLLFVSTKCKICLVFLRYMEKLSVLLSNNFNIFIFADGLSLDEPARFGGGYICPDSNNLRRTFQVSFSPAIVMSLNGKYLKFTGVDACNVAVGKMLMASFGEEVHD